MNDNSFFGKQLADGKMVEVTPNGRSMLPLLDGSTDSVIVYPLEGVPEKHSLLLYRDTRELLVVHRVYEVHEDRSTCDMLGDGNITIERDLPFDRILGVVREIKRNGKIFPVTNPVYRMYVSYWMKEKNIARRNELMNSHGKNVEKIKKLIGFHPHEND